MKLTTYVSASAFIFISALIIRNNEAKHQSESLYNNKWSLRKIITVKESYDVNGKAFIRFDEKKQSAGGNGGCNAFGSTTLVSSNTVSFSEIFSTKMFCEGVQEQENAYMSNLAAANRFEIRGDRLFIYRDKILLLEFLSLE